MFTDALQQDLDDELEQAVAEWRARHRLAEDDAVLLLIELFRIHQRHWDELRRRELPAFDEFRSNVANITEAARSLNQDAALLVQLLRNGPAARRTPRVTRAAAIVAALATLLAGYFLGRTWP